MTRSDRNHFAARGGRDLIGRISFERIHRATGWASPLTLNQRAATVRFIPYKEQINNSTRVNLPNDPSFRETQVARSIRVADSIVSA